MQKATTTKKKYMDTIQSDDITSKRYLIVRVMTRHINKPRPDLYVYELSFTKRLKISCCCSSGISPTSIPVSITQKRA